MPADPEQSFRGMLWGTAVGDAWGYPTEFLKRAKILRWYGAGGPQFPAKPRISDDTQMTLALASGLAEASGEGLIEIHAIDHFLKWLDDFDNNRAPGGTCMSSLRRLKESPAYRWWEHTSIDSKGNGANMRVGPAAFMPNTDIMRRTAWTQAAITHGHPTALIASEYTTAAVWLLAHGHQRPAGLLDYMAVLARGEYATKGDPFIYEIAGIGHIAQRRGQQFGWDLVEDGVIVYDDWYGEYQGQGRWEVAEALTRAAEAVDSYAPGDDPCDYAGQGWSAEEALAVALLCIEVSERHHPGDPYAALRLAASTNGDSDTIGAIAGAILGAHHGPEPYREIGKDIEPRYREWMDTVPMPRLLRAGDAHHRYEE